MVRAILFGVAIIGGIYMVELQTGRDYGVGRTITAFVGSVSGGYGTSVGLSGGAGGAISGVASSAGGVVTGAVGALGGN